MSIASPPSSLVVAAADDSRLLPFTLRVRPRAEVEPVAISAKVDLQTVEINEWNFSLTAIEVPINCSWVNATSGTKYVYLKSRR